MRLRRTAGLTALVVLSAILTAEAALQIGARLIGDRSGDGWRPGAWVRVLAVGDSHTFGTMVPDDEAYPAQLQKTLDEVSPGTYSVLNLGVPGMSVTQVRNRVPIYAKRYEPDIVLVWCGVNEAWNQAEIDRRRGGWRVALDGYASRLRLYRFVRVWLHDRRLQRAAEPDGAEQRHRVVADKPLDSNAMMTTYKGNVIERIQHVGGEFRPDEEMEQRAFEGYEAMVSWGRSAGIPIVFIAYPLDIGAYGAANRAIRRVGERYGVPVVEASQSVKRVPEELVEWKWAAHPNGPMYGEIARDVAPVVVGLRSP